MRHVLIFTALMAVTWSVQAGEPRTAGVPAVTKPAAELTHQGRPYTLLIPKGVKGKRPLLIAMHGGGGNMNHLRRNLDMDKVAQQRGFMVAYISGSGPQRRIVQNMRTWNGGGCCGAAVEKNIDDVAYINGFIKEMIATQNADPARIYMTGHSNGGIMTYRFICEKPGVVAAAVPVSGPLMVPECKSGPVRVLHLHGENDDNVLVRGGYGSNSLAKADFTSVAATASILKAAGADVTVKIVPDAGHALTDVSDKLKAQTGKTVAETIADFVER